MEHRWLSAQLCWPKRCTYPISAPFRPSSDRRCKCGAQKFAETPIAKLSDFKVHRIWNSENLKWMKLHENWFNKASASHIYTICLFCSIFRRLRMVQTTSIAWINRISRFTGGTHLLHGVMFHTIATCIIQTSKDMRLVQAHSARNQLRWLSRRCDAAAVLLR